MASQIVRPEGCICIEFRDTGGFRIADLTCPVHGVNGTTPGDGPWDTDPHGTSNLPPEAMTAHSGRATGIPSTGIEWPADGTFSPPISINDPLDDLNRLTGAGYDVVMGTRKGPGATGVYVALEHLSLDEPKEFYAITLLDALRQACFWSTASGTKRKD